MLDQKEVEQTSQNFHNKIRGIFKKYGLAVKILDNDTSGKRPDYFVYTKRNEKEGFVCECKYIASAGVLDNGKYHVSMHDPKLHEHDIFKCETYYDKVQEVLKRARQQYIDLINDLPEYKKFPFVVALEFDFFADCFHMIEKSIFNYTEISALIRLDRDYEKKVKLKGLSLEQLEKLIKKEVKIKLPPDTLQFKVLMNSSPNVKFNAKKFLRSPIII